MIPTSTAACAGKGSGRGSWRRCSTCPSGGSGSTGRGRSFPRRHSDARAGCRCRCSIDVVEAPRIGRCPPACGRLPGEKEPIGDEFVGFDFVLLDASGGPSQKVRVKERGKRRERVDLIARQFKAFLTGGDQNDTE